MGLEFPKLAKFSRIDVTGGRGPKSNSSQPAKRWRQATSRAVTIYHKNTLCQKSAGKYPLVVNNQS